MFFCAILKSQEQKKKKRGKNKMTIEKIKEIKGNINLFVYYVILVLRYVLKKDLKSVKNVKDLEFLILELVKHL